MPGSHKFELKFVADVEGILKDFQGLMARLQQVVQQGIRIPASVELIGPLAGTGGGNQGLNVTSSPGTSMRGAGPGIRDIFGRTVSPGGVPNDPVDSRDAYQRFRQDDPALSMAMSQRGMSEREKHILMMTGGRGASEFLSERIKGLSGAEDSESKATLLALNKFKTELDSTTNILGRLKKEREEAVAAGDIGRASAAQREMEDRTRIKESIIQAAGGGGGGGGADPIAAALAGLLTAGVIKKVMDVMDRALGSTGLAIGQAAKVQDLNTATLQAGLRMNAEDILVTLNPGMRARAGVVGSNAYLNAVLQQAGKVGIGAAGGAAGGSIFGGVGAVPGALIGGAGAAVSGFGMDFLSYMQGGAPYESKAAEATLQALQGLSGINKIDIMSGNLGLERAQSRLGFRSAFGLSSMDMIGMSTGQLMPMTARYGFGEEEMLGGLMGMAPFGRANLPSMLRMGRSGIGAEFQQAQIQRLMHGDVGNAQQELEDLMSRAVARGNDNSEIGKRQVDAITSMAYRAGGFGGAAGTGIFEQAMRIAQGMSGVGPGRAADVAQGGMNTIMGELNQRTGLQGLMNMMTAQRIVDRFFGHVDPGTRSRLVLLFGRYDPSQWSNPEFQRIVAEEASRGGGRMGGSMADIQNFAMATGQAISGAFASVPGSADPRVNRLIMSREGTLQDVLQTTGLRRGFMRGEGRIPEGGVDFEARDQRIKDMDVFLNQLTNTELLASGLANQGIMVLNQAMKDWANGGLKMVTDAIIKGRAGEGGYEVQVGGAQVPISEAANYKNRAPSARESLDVLAHH